MWRQAAVAIGLCLIVVGLSGLVLSITRAFPTALAPVLGGLGVRTIAGVAVTGCLFAAIGYWDQ